MAEIIPSLATQQAMTNFTEKKNCMRWSKGLWEITRGGKEMTRDEKENTCTHNNSVIFLCLSVWLAGTY